MGWFTINRKSIYICLQAVAGLLADAKHLVDNAREEAANYRANYGASIPLKVRTHLYIVQPQYRFW